MHYVNTSAEQEHSAEDPEDLQVFVRISQRFPWSNETLARPTSCFAPDPGRQSERKSLCSRVILQNPIVVAC